MIDIEMEISSLFLALRLANAVEDARERGEDDFTLFRNFAGIIKDYERGKSKSEQNHKYNF